MTKFSDIVCQDNAVLIHFYLGQELGCQQVESDLVRVANHFTSTVTVVQIDVAKNPQLCEALRIKQTPTFLLYKNKTMIWRQSKVMDANGLINVVETLL